MLPKDPVLRDRFEDVDSKLKSALTKLYNALEHRSQALVASQGAPKKRRTDVGGGEGGEEYEHEDENDEVDDEEEAGKGRQRQDVGDVSAFIKAKKKSDTASKKASSSTSNKPNKKAPAAATQKSGTGARKK